MSRNLWRLGASGIAVCGALAATSANAALSIEVLSSRPDLVSNASALIAICHSFGLLCRWSGAAQPVLRAEKSSGMPTNVLSDAIDTTPALVDGELYLRGARHLYRISAN